MESHINKKVAQFQIEFKTAIKTWFEIHQAHVKCDNKDITSEFLQYMFDSNGMTFLKEDFQPRKRVKNLVPYNERCFANRANNEQCTRKKKKDHQLCGTHIKGTPNGIMQQDPENMKPVIKTEVWVKEIKGIHYYIDDQQNVYKPEDILANKTNPEIIAKWTLNEAGVYQIPLFGI
jgi:hypothetical protein